MADLWHSWGKSPKQKAREKEYNHAYYLRNKDKWKDSAKRVLFKDGVRGMGFMVDDAVDRAEKKWYEDLDRANSGPLNNQKDVDKHLENYKRQKATYHRMVVPLYQLQDKIGYGRDILKRIFGF